VLTATTTRNPTNEMAMNTAYSGPERRIHLVLVTQNTEYHMRKKRCLRVRDRTSRVWLDEHQAVSKELLASVAVTGEDACLNVSGIPAPGELLYFGTAGGHIVTSPILTIERPSKQLVRQEYPPIF